MNRIALRFKDGSDLDYTVSYDVPENVPLRVIAELSKAYQAQFGALEGSFELDQVERLNFEEWVLETAGVIIVPVDIGEEYDGFTGEPW